MRLCTDTITLFNARFDAVNDCDVYAPTVISGVSWYDEIASNVDQSGLKAADKYIIRIPTDAGFSGKTYADPIAYASGNPNALFTLKSGDIIVKGSVSVSNPTPAMLQKMFPEVATILAVTDNRRASNAPHWKVVGK